MQKSFIKNKKLVLTGAFVSSFVIVLDQITKHSVMAMPAGPKGLVEILPFLNFTAVWNRGISFGLFGADNNWWPYVLSAVAIIISSIMAFWLLKTTRASTALAFAIIIGGAIGNVIDRFRFGAVFDFIDFNMLGYHFPAFNVADACISIGAFLLILDSIIFADDKPNKG